MNKKVIVALLSLLGLNVNAQSSGSAKAECEEIMNALIPFAQQMLEKHGEFFPFGGTMKNNGEVTQVAGYDVRVVLPSTGQKSDAVAVALDHRDNYSVVVYFPYQIKGGKVAFGDLFAVKGEASVFK